jgi:hypothetical protein
MGLQSRVQHVSGAPDQPPGAPILTSKDFPRLISAPFGQGFAVAPVSAALMLGVAAWASWLRGGRCVHDEAPTLELRTVGR